MQVPFVAEVAAQGKAKDFFILVSLYVFASDSLFVLVIAFFYLI